MCVRTSLALFWAMIALSGFVLPAHAEVYKYTDESGRTHFVDDEEKIPPQFRDVGAQGLKLPAVSRYRAPAFAPKSEAAPARVSLPFSRSDKRPLSSRGKKVKMYSTSWCSACRVAEEFFKQHRIPFEKADIETDPRAEREYKGLGVTGVPVIKVGNQVMTGFNEEKLRALFAK